MRYRFGSHSLDTEAVELRCDGEPVALEPRTFGVLEYLIRHRDRAVRKEELLDELWGDRFVGDAALTTQIRQARSAVGDDGRAQRVIRTLHRVGYRFVADVVEDPTGEGIGASVSPAWVRPAPFFLFGREQDEDAVRHRLAGHRLVTITGPAGVGKTALALRLAASSDPLGAPDGVWVCELANTRDPGAVSHLVLTAIGAGQQSDADPAESLLRILERRQSVLVLDNCEHVLDAIRSLVEQILGRCPDVKLVATSRMPLGVGGESIYPLAPLAIEDAAACFAARAEAAGASIDPTDPALVDLCRRLDCVPLALELAAARARLLAPAEMVELLTDRFRLLRGKDPGAERHGSMHQAIAWSWDALSSPDQHLLCRLSSFAGTFTLEDVRAVALPGADPLDAVDALGRLVSGSLLAAVPASGGHTRFRLLESIRDFALERLAEPAALQKMHAAHFAGLAESLDAAFQTEAIDDALAAMHAAWDNLRAAVAYAAGANDPWTIRRIIRAVGPYADVFQVYEVLDWCDHAALDEVTKEDGGRLVVAAEALAVKARMLAHRGDQEHARALATTAHDLCETHATLLSIVWCAYYAGELDLVMASAERLVELSRSGKGFDRAFADGFVAIVIAVRQQADITSSRVAPADAESGVLGAQACLTEGLRLCTIDPARASELLQAVVDSAVRHDYRLLLGAAASTLTQITLPGRPSLEAMRILRHTLTLYVERSMWVLISADTVMAAKLLANHGEIETACRLLGARVASGYAAGLSEVLRVMLQEELQQQLGARFTELADQGAAWRPPEAGAEAITALDRAIARAAVDDPA